MIFEICFFSELFVEVPLQRHVHKQVFLEPVLIAVGKLIVN